MITFKEYYEVGTDAYTKHAKSCTPGQNEDAFKPHMMYDPKTGKGYKAEKPEDHERMAKMGYTHEKPDVKEGRAESDAVKAFLAKGGKIKRLPPGKAAGYHGKDDPGKDVGGILNKRDSSKFKRGKKVRSMR